MSNPPHPGETLREDIMPVLNCRAGIAVDQSQHRY
jgi:plasmid maintenance system antidote protein VapI